MPSSAALKRNNHRGYTSQLKMGWNDQKIIPKYALALKLAQISMLFKKWGKKNWGNYQLHKWSLPKIIQILALFQETCSFCFQCIFSCHPPPHTLSVRIWLAVQHIRVSAGAGLSCTHQDKSGLHYWASFKAHDCSWAYTFLSNYTFMKNQLIQCVKITSHFFPFDCCGSY